QAQSVRVDLRPGHPGGAGIRAGRKNLTAARPPLSPLLKLVLEMGPLVLFFVLNARAGIFTATGVFVGATLLALAVHYALVRKLPIMPLVSGVVVVVFGGLTLLLHDELFIKIK